MTSWVRANPLLKMSGKTGELREIQSQWPAATDETQPLTNDPLHLRISSTGCVKKTNDVIMMSF